MKNKNLRILLFALCSLFIFSACQETVPQHAPQSIPKGKGSVTLIIDGINGRTILPSGLSQFNAYTVTFINSVTNATETFDRTAITEPFYLEPGNYNVQVTAYADTAKTKTAAQGQLTGITVIEGANAALNITLNPIITAGNQGTFKWEIKFPADLSPASFLNITPVDPANDTQLEPIPFSLPSPFTGSRALKTGYYRLVFYLIRENAQEIQFNEFVHIYDNLESFFTYEFKDEHFNNIKYTITFDYDNGTSLPVTYFHGNQISKTTHEPAINKPIPAGLYLNPPPNNCTFDGWDYGSTEWDYTKPITCDMTLTARWTAPTINISNQNGTTIIEKAASYANTHSASYTLFLDSDVTINGYAFTGAYNLTIIGLTSVTLSPQTNILFTIQSGITLTIGKNIILQGVSDNDNALVTVNTGGTFNMTGGKITGNTYKGDSYNATVYVNGTFNMSGGEITDNHNNSTYTYGNGGAVYVTGNGTFSMSGDAEITGNNTLSTISTAVYIAGASSFTMAGNSKVTSNTSPLGDVFIDSGASLTLSDNATIGTLTLSAGPTGNSYATINSGWTESVTTSLNLWGGPPNFNDIINLWLNKKVLDTTDAGTVVKFQNVSFVSSNGNKQSISTPQPAAPYGYTISTSAPDTGKLVAEMYEARIGSTYYTTLAAAIAAATGGTSTPPTEIVILRDITSDSGYEIYNAKNIKLTADTGKNCTITASDGGFALFTVSTGSLTLGGSGGSLILSGGSVASTTGRRGVYVMSGAFVMSNNVTIENFKNNADASPDGYGGGVYVANGTFKMDGGNIQGNSVSGSGNNNGNGGGVYFTGTTFDMSGGTIGGTAAGTANTATNGGGVYVAGGKFTMSGDAKIIGNTASSNGGGLNITNGPLAINGGKISGNSSGSYGGGVYSNFTLTMSDGEISGNTANNNFGGGVYITDINSNFTMSGGTIGKTASETANTADKGGGVYVANNGKFTMTNGFIKGNTANTNGGGVFINSGTFEMNGGEISTGNKTNSGSGGGVYLNNGTVNMSGSTSKISGNQANGTGSSGGGVFVANGTFTMTGGQIGKAAPADTANSATGNGGGVYVASGGTFNLTSGVIGGTGTDCNTATSGGGVYVAATSSTAFTLGDGGIIKGNTANGTASTNGGGGIYFASGTSFEMSGGTIGADGSPNKVPNEISANTGGGGIYFAGTNFKMSGGTICYNNSGIYGGGVYFASNNNTFEMSGGIINNNSASNGGGVFSPQGNFKMSGGGGIIKNNNATTSGGGVNIQDGNFEMSAGIIEGNNATSTTGCGGGVSFTISNGHTGNSFTMSGGTIKSNTASSNGGGVYLISGTFKMSGGTIYGSDGETYTPPGAPNTATSGAAIFVNNNGTASYDGAYGTDVISTTDNTLPQ